MFEGRRVVAVVPAYNEEKLIGRVLETMPACVDRILIVDDASTDSTPSILAAARDRMRDRVRVIRHEKNGGVGAAIVTGYSALSPIVKAEMFPTKVRALGVGLPHALVAATFGGTAEPVALALKQFGHESAFFYYVAGCAALTWIAAYFMKETRGNSTLDPATTPQREAIEVRA